VLKPNGNVGYGSGAEGNLLQVGKFDEDGVAVDD
jgi:hypothetical protein